MKSPALEDSTTIIKTLQIYSYPSRRHGQQEFLEPAGSPMFKVINKFTIVMYNRQQKKKGISATAADSAKGTATSVKYSNKETTFTTPASCH